MFNSRYSVAFVIILLCFLLPLNGIAQNGLVAPYALQVEITDSEQQNVWITWSFDNYEAIGFEGFNIYRNGTKINENPFEDNFFLDEEMELGTYVYEAQAVYASGTSPKSNAGTVTIREGFHFDMGSGDPSFATWSVFINSSALGQEVLSPGDEIAIFDGEVNTGRHKLTDEPYAGDEDLIELVSFSQFAEHDGYTPGNPYTFKLYDASNDTVYSEFVAEFDDSSDDFYVGEVFPGSSDPLSVIDLNFSLGLPQPINLEVSSEDHDIILQWNIEEDDDGNLLGYNVYRDGEKITDNPVDATTYTDQQMLSGTYEYYVVAVYEEGTSIPSNTVEFTLGTVYFDPPDAEGNLTSPMKVYIHGASIMENAMVGFDEIGIFRRTETDTLCMGAISLKQIIEPDSPDSITVYADNPETEPIEGFETGNQLYYRLYDYDQDVEYIKPLTQLNEEFGNTSDTYSPNSENHVTLSWLPFAPKNFSAGINEYDITLSWDENAENNGLGLSFQGYDIFRDGTKLNESPVQETEFLDEELLVDEYHYHVRGVYEESVSRNSDTITAVIPTQYFTPVSDNETSGSMTFYITQAMVDGENMQTYDEVGIFTDSESGEICVGAGSLHYPLSEQNPMKITAFKDDPNTGVIDGFQEGDSIRYRFYYNSTENYYNTIEYTFPYEAGQGYNFENFSEKDTCYVNLSFNTPPPVKFFFDASDYCNNTSQSIYATVEDFQKIHELHLGIAIDTSDYSFQSLTAYQDFLESMQVTDLSDTIRIDWASVNTYNLNDGDTLFGLNIQTKQQGQTSVDWTEDSFSEGMEYQEDEFYGEGFTINDVPGAASNIVGDTEVCNGVNYSSYSTSSIENADEYVWEINPENAGQLTPSGTSCQVFWNDGFDEQATLSVAGSNDCGLGQQSEIDITIQNSVYVSVSLEFLANSNCEGDTIQIFADVENPGNNPTYNWYVNDELFYETSNTLTSTNLSDGDIIYCEVESSQTCAENNPATSNTIEIDIDPLPHRPDTIAGDTILCNTIQDSEYITPGSQFSESYDWNLDPDVAGSIECINDNCQEIKVVWNTNFEGMTALWVRGVNECGFGPYISSPHNIYRDYCTSFQNLNADDWKLYPNPAEDYIKIKLEYKINYTWQLISASGKTLLSGQASNQSATINLTSVNQGVYFIRLQTSESVFVRKVIKK